jgi:hypothetical protein
MTTIIAFLFAIGVITSTQEATPELIQEYEQEYQESIVVIEDLDEI